jgi:hypothetical protein
VTQPPDDHTQRFDPYRDDDDSTRAMPPVPPARDDDATRFFPFDEGDQPRGGSGYPDDATRAYPGYPADDATQVYRGEGFPGQGPPDATRAYPADPTRPISGSPYARGSAAPVPPVGGYGGGRDDDYGHYDDEPEPGGDGKRRALIIGGIVLAILLVTGVGVLAGNAIFGGTSNPQPTQAPITTLAPTASPTPSEIPSESATPSEPTISQPPPEGPGPRILSVSAPSTVDCSGGGAASVQLGWRVRGTDKVVVSVDGNEYQQYAPDDQPVSVPFPCDGQAHKYQLTAFSNDDRQSQPRQVTVRPQAATTPLFPESTPDPSAS